MISGMALTPRTPLKVALDERRGGLIPLDTATHTTEGDATAPHSYSEHTRRIVAQLGAG